MEFVTFFVPTIEYLGFFSYWLILLISLLESLAFVGELFPGAVMIVFVGFLSSEGYLNLGSLILFSAAGAIFGDAISYWLGSKSVKLFNDTNKVFKLSHIRRGEEFFQKHGNKSVFLGRFVGPLRPIVPFVAGLSRMNARSFMFWNILSAFLWVLAYLSLGYFFVDSVEALEALTVRVGLFITVVIGFCFGVWLFVRRKK